MMVATMVFLPDAVLAAPLPDLAWLSGDWRRCKDGEIVEERWLGPRSGLLIGANLDLVEGQGELREPAHRGERRPGPTWASPMGRTPVPFRLIEAGAQRARVRQSRARISCADRLLARRRRTAHRRDDQGQAGGGRVALREGNGGRLSAIALI